jgi:hypothetical protein
VRAGDGRPDAAAGFQKLVVGTWNTVPLALLDANHHALAVDVAHPQMQGFADAHTSEYMVLKMTRLE